MSLETAVSQLQGRFVSMPEFVKRTAKYTKNANGVSRDRRFCINGGMLAFETRFPRDSQKPEVTAVPRTRWRSDIRNFSPSSPAFASCGPSSSKSLKYNHGRRSFNRILLLLPLFLLKIIPRSPPAHPRVTPVLLFKRLP